MQGAPQPPPTGRAAVAWSPQPALSRVVACSFSHTALATRALVLLQREATARRKEAVTRGTSEGRFDAGESVVAVCAAIRGVVGPFSVIMEK